MVVGILIFDVLILLIMIYSGSSKNIESRTEHEADLLDKHFEEELTPPAVKAKKKKYYHKKKTNLDSKVN